MTDYFKYDFELPWKESSLHQRFGRLRTGTQLLNKHLPARSMFPESMRQIQIHFHILWSHDGESDVWSVSEESWLETWRLCNDRRLCLNTFGEFCLCLAVNKLHRRDPLSSSQCLVL